MCVTIKDGSGRTLRNDIYDKNLQALIEAKGSTDRDSIRMALGQVLDYRRACAPTWCGVLLPSKPDQDLIDLLARSQIATIWETSSGFRDSVNGALV